MDDYLPEALFAFQNDFDHISNNISYNKPRIPDMINIISPSAFENEITSLKEASKEIHNLFLTENCQYFIQQPNTTESFNQDQTYILHNLRTENDELKNEFNTNSITQFEEEEQNEIFQLFHEIDGFSNPDQQAKKVQYPLESLVQKDFRPFNVTHFFTFF